MTLKEAILYLISDFDLTIGQSLNFIAAILYLIAGLMVFNTLVPIFRGLVQIIDILIDKIKAKKEARKNASN